MKIRNRLLINYVLIFFITSIIAVMSFYFLGFLSNMLENRLIKNQFPALSLMKDDVKEIDYNEVIENHGGIQVVDKNYNIIYSKGINVFPKSQLSATEFSNFLIESQSIRRKYSYDIAFNESNEFWLIVTFPVSLRFDFSIAYNDYYTSNDSTSVFWIISIALLFYFMMLFISTKIYSRMTAQSFTRPLSMLQESVSRLSKGDYTSRVNLNLKNEFGDLERSFNNMAEKIEEEIKLRKQSENSRRQLTLDIAHDLKNPLAIVMGYAEYCLKNPTKINEQYLNIIHHNSSRANALITGLFELSKLENSEYVLNKTKTDIAEYLRIKVSDTMSTIESSGLLYDYDLPDNEIFVNIDTKEINRVLDNLIENAIRYNDKGTKITISLIEHENHCEIIVEDNGKGIAQKLTDKIFMPFVRADEARNSETGGSGLGLAIADKIIKMHNGNISLISDIGKGCKFIINLPLI